jgi:hypothetical protein
MPSVAVSHTPRTRVVRTLFFAEMAVSPFLAALAILAQVALDWGVYGYVPAVVWLALFIQCLFTFRWRGSWFLLGPPVAYAAIMVFLVMAPPAPKLAAPTTASVH